MSVRTIEWVGAADGQLRLLDQTQLPATVAYLECFQVEEVGQAIRQLSVRGAPAIGIAAAYGVVLAARQGKLAVREACDYLATSRPTAVNLFWALQRMRQATARAAEGELGEQLLAEAQAIHEEDRQTCAAIGRQGADLLGKLPAGSGILTHCNTGALATGGEGTALAVLTELQRRGWQPQVYADETRPLLQGSRLTMWELQQQGIAATLICDSMAGQVMREGRVQAVIVGADRIAANGDTANKIGTYSVAQLARAHQLPFYVAAPTTTFDLSLESGEAIPIEQRRGEEITQPMGVPIAPHGVQVYNPAFDVTPAGLLAGIITERGVIAPVSRQTVDVAVNSRDNP